MDLATIRTQDHAAEVQLIASNGCITRNRRAARSIQRVKKRAFSFERNERVPIRDRRNQFAGAHVILAGFNADGALADRGRIVLGGFLDGQLQGTVTLYLGTPPNQPFRGEIWKLMVAPVARKRGLARALMLEAHRLATVHGRTLLTLDTATEGGAAELYESLGWIRSGVIPGYAYKPQGAIARGGERQRATGDYEAWTPK